MRTPNTTELRRRSVDAGRTAGAHARDVSGALVAAVARLVDRAIDEILLSDVRVVSAAEGRQLLARDEESETHSRDIQRVVVLAVPVIRRLARGARFTRVPWVMIGSTAVSVGVAVRTGVREVQVLSSLIAHRLEGATGAPSDRDLVEKLAIDLYLHPKREPRLTDDKLRLVRLTRKWVFGGMFGRDTEKRAGKALDAAERLDAAALSEQWRLLKRPQESQAPAD